LAARLYTPLYFTVRSTVAYRWQALGPASGTILPP
jgi:hypothetical protein